MDRVAQKLGMWLSLPQRGSGISLWSAIWWYRVWLIGVVDNLFRRADLQFERGLFFLFQGWQWETKSGQNCAAESEFGRSRNLEETLNDLGSGRGQVRWKFKVLSDLDRRKGSDCNLEVSEGYRRRRLGMELDRRR